MRIVFMGTPEFAVPTLDALIGAGHEIVAVYSQPPRPAGRGKGLRASAIHRRAEVAGLAVWTPLRLDPDEQRAFAALDSDIAVVAAYGLILPEAVLAAPALGCLNVHASLLPRWRGAAPIQRAILAGDETTGVSIMRMERGLDTGPVYATRATPVDAKTAGQLTKELAGIGAALMITVLDDLSRLQPIPQRADGVTYAAKLAKSEARLDFTAPAAIVERQIRAFNPRPGAFFVVGEERIRILDAAIVDRRGEAGTILDLELTIACGEQAIVPALIQRAGRAAMTPSELLRGFPLPPGTRLA